MNSPTASNPSNSNNPSEGTNAGQTTAPDEVTMLTAMPEVFRDALHQCRVKMQREALPEVVIANFERLFAQVARGDTGVIQEEEIEPVGCVLHLDELLRVPAFLERGTSLLDQLVVVRLNGGLGTTMGLDCAKSLLKVKGELSFNDLLAKQLQTLNEKLHLQIPLVHMTSFRTEEDICAVMEQHPQLAMDGVPVTFKQHMHPKLFVDSLFPAAEADEESNWNPPGHGDIYAALIATGIAQALLARGKRYMFVANSDNLGASVEPAILGYFAESGASFLMETAERTEADSKGGHLARRRGTGNLLLREVGQAPTENGQLTSAFSDITRYEHFNTNNLWLDLVAVMKVAEQHGGCIPLPLISNRKPVNPSDKKSAPVIQVETAMGAAIEVFDRAVAIRVPRSRFAPVKTNGDLLVVRSDAYELTAAGQLECVTPTTLPPMVSLDPKFFGLLDDFERRVQVLPSLRYATSLKVTGDVSFTHPVEIRGKVTISASEGHTAVVPVDCKVLEDCDVRL
jgi:UTP--glucose-1-phosphate uridylyltransferase